MKVVGYVIAYNILRGGGSQKNTDLTTNLTHMLISNFSSIIAIRAEKSDFWKSISKAAAQGDLNRFYPPCIVNAGSDVLDG